jgi:hypothetical protein
MSNPSGEKCYARCRTEAVPAGMSACDSMEYVRTSGEVPLARTVLTAASLNGRVDAQRSKVDTWDACQRARSTSPAAW